MSLVDQFVGLKPFTFTNHLKTNTTKRVDDLLQSKTREYWFSEQRTTPWKRWIHFSVRPPQLRLMGTVVPNWQILISQKWISKSRLYYEPRGSIVGVGVSVCSKAVLTSSVFTWSQNTAEGSENDRRSSRVTEEQELVVSVKQTQIQFQWDFSLVFISFTLISLDWFDMRKILFFLLH